MTDFPRYFENSPRFMNYKNGSDLFLGYLMTISTYDAKTRNIYLYRENFSTYLPQLKSILNSKTSSTVNNQLKYWCGRSNGLVEEKLVMTSRGEGKASIVISPELEKTSWTKIPNSIVTFLIHSEIPNILRIYIYLVCQYRIHAQKKYIFTKKELMMAIGYSEKTNAKVKTETQKALTFLQKSGLIKYHCENRKINNHFFPCHILDKVESESLTPRLIYKGESVEEYQERIRTLINLQNELPEISKPQPVKTAAEPIKEEPKENTQLDEALSTTDLKLREQQLKAQGFYNTNNREEMKAINIKTCQIIKDNKYAEFTKEQKMCVTLDSLCPYMWKIEQKMVEKIILQ